MTKKWNFLFFATTMLLALCSSCYRMPTEDDIGVKPTTNNPKLTGDKMPFMPGVSY